MTTFTVSTTADIDDGNFSQLSLRKAVNLANATTEADVIAFAPAIESQTLVLTGGELVVMNDVTIHGGGVTLDGMTPIPRNGELPATASSASPAAGPMSVSTT